ncbi:MAG: T9SS type A sorting domain-containing protein [Bacteroidales bacterium]|nr:T9SS type A sorting domain-containing protein [Bacteroidales bacterium]
MKKTASTFTIFILALMFAKAQEVKDVSIVGTITEDKTVSASYIINNPSGGEAVGFLWMNVNTATDDTTDLATTETYIIQSTDVGLRLLLRVDIDDGSVQDTAYSALSGVVISNSAPVAQNVSIAGGTFQDDVLTGDYDYSDADDDQEGDSNYSWSAGTSTNQGSSIIIPSGTGISYKIRDVDQGKYIFFGVQPVAANGEPNGTLVWSSAHGPVNSQPYASSVSVSDLTPEVGDVLSGTYTYNDDDGESEGSSSYRWLREGAGVIPGADSDTYTVTFDDIAYKLIFEVTPVASSGYPLEGDPVQSAATAEVPASGEPLASDVCISGTRTVGSVLTGNYTYTYGKQEGTSLYRWYRDGSPIAGATSISYTLTEDDIESNISFAVTPVSKSPAVTGTETFSDNLALFILSNTEVSVSDPPVNLSASPTGGVFSGPGVSLDSFDPSAVNTDNSPFVLEYILSLQYTGHTCTQKSVDTISVVPVETYFTSFKNVYCYDNGNDTIVVENMPADATMPVFEFTEPAAVVAQLNDTTIVFNPALMGPGNNADSVYFRYVQSLSVIEISRGFIVDSVSTALSFQNLEDQYCTDASARFISVDNIYPAGGSADWTGDMLTNESASSAVFDPGLVAAGSSYPVTYRYTSPNGCKSSIISKNVTINPLPDPSFSLNPSYNVEGDPDLLVPVLPGGAFTGSGIVGDEFYPGLAGVGNHDIRYSVTDANGCFATTTNTTDVREAQGSIDDLPAVICYDDTTYTVSISGLPAGVILAGFSNTGGGITQTGPLVADYYIPGAGSGYDTLSFAYVWDGVDYELKQQVYMDSIGKVEIIDLMDEYCEYEGDVNMRVSVENSSGTGNFSFSGPDSSFTDYGQIADLYPYKTPPSAAPYQVSYTHVSSVQSSGCSKTVSRDVYVHAEPDIDILTDRATANLEEDPFILEGVPADGTFSGDGVYKDGAVYKFNPSLAGEGSTSITFSYIDGNTCFSSVAEDILVVKAQGTIEGIDAGNQYCYDGQDDTLSYENAGTGWTGIGFQGNGINVIDPVSAVFDPSQAGKGEHQVFYSYYDSVMTRFDIPVSLSVDSVGTVVINNLDAGDEFCSNLEPFELFTTKQGGVFSGPVDEGFFDPSLGLGDTNVSYTYINDETGCSTSVSVPVRINPAPVVDFDVEDVCIENDNDTTVFINNTVSGDAVSSWAWRFGDPGSFNESEFENPGHLYDSYGPRKVVLTATTVNGCTSTTEKNIDLGVKPAADFAWTGDCYVVNDSILIFDSSVSPAPVEEYSWSFFDGETPLTGEEIRYPKTAVGDFSVKHIVKTTYNDCHDTITRTVTIRPTITLDQDDYYEDFESGEAGWIHGLDENINEWSFGTPGRTNINSAASGTNAWYTSYDMNGQAEVNYSVESPCFDFTNIERPYVSVDIFKHFDTNRDGAALQYEIGNSGNWKLVGSLDDGIEWYNSVLINGEPGGQSIGWTSIGGQDTGWINVRNKLDLISGKKNVKFRMIYGSDGTAKNNEGFAFDNFSISTRSRKVLMEHFTNYNNSANSDANLIVNEVMDNMQNDVINLQYHTNIPAADDFYYDNEDDISGRLLFYGLSETPYSFVDGGINLEYANEYDFGEGNAVDSVDLYKRSMINPLFNMELSSQIDGGILSVSCDVSAAEDISAENLTLYIAVIEKEINYDAPNGESIFYNVFKKMLPDAGGTDMNKDWAKDESVSYDNFSWLIGNIYDTGDIEIVAFIQNNVTREVYQSVSTIQVNVPTAVDDPELVDMENHFAVYPNPATDHLTIKFSTPTEEDMVLNICDYSGKVVLEKIVPGGSELLGLERLSLKEGMYFVRLIKGAYRVDYKKLIIVGE